MDPYIGELRMFAGNFGPAGWAQCNGVLLPIAEYDALYSLIGTTYGGDGQTTFGLPNLSGRAPIHVGPGFTQGQMAGEETVTLTATQMPVHTHTMQGSQNPATTAAPQGAVLASVATAGTFPYGKAAPIHSLDPSSIQPAGYNQPHENRQPYLCITWIISLFGTFPAQP